MTVGRVNSSPSSIRMFLRADTAEDLVRLQLQTNLAGKGRFDYTDFTFAKDKWYCWFMVDVNEFPHILGVINGNETD